MENGKRKRMEESDRMGKIAILTDSCADLSRETAEAFGIYVIPLSVVYPEKIYADGVDITAEDVYRRMPEEVPSTTLPSGEAIFGTLERIRDEGYSYVLALMLSSGISGTYNAVRLAAQSFKEMEIRVFDTQTASLGLGMIALQAAEWVRKGKSWLEMQGIVTSLIRNTKVFFCVDTLEYLRRGGRIGRISCVAGSVLQIKPIITFSSDGQLVNVDKVRGRQKSIQEIALKIQNLVPEKGAYNMALAHGGCPEELEILRKALGGCLRKSRMYCESAIDSVLASHVGPRLIGAGVQVLEWE